MHDITGLIAAIGKFIYNGDEGTGKGSDSVFRTEIGQNRSLIVRKTNNMLWTFPNTCPKPGHLKPSACGTISLSFLMLLVMALPWKEGPSFISYP